MASSIAVTTSFIPAVTKLLLTDGGRGGRNLSVVKATAGENSGMEFKTKETANQEIKVTKMRRDVIFAAAAASAAAFSLSKVATAGEEPGRGTVEAKKKYAPICVTMPTARICRK